MAKHTVLICDDNQAVHNSLTCYSEPEGFSILSAYNGETALAYIEVDAVILNVMLPEMEGYEVCREIRRHSTVFRTIESELQKMTCVGTSSRQKEKPS